MRAANPVGVGAADSFGRFTVETLQGFYDRRRRSSCEHALKPPAARPGYPVMFGGPRWARKSGLPTGTPLARRSA